MFKKLSLLALISLLQLSSFAQEAPPDWKFIILRSPHFDIVVNAEQQELGQLYASKLEQAHRYLGALISDKPERTVVVISDRTDITNGYATQIPYPHIVAYPVIPSPQESLSEPGDWALEFLTHEYTHILNFAPSPGVIKPLRMIFGTVISPNLLLPRWWKEGVAVHLESRIGGHGRLNSLYQDATIRSFVFDNKLHRYNVGEINEVLPSWPEGMRAYLFGSLFWSQMTAEKSDQVIESLFQRHGGRIPYAIETPAIDHLGRDYQMAYLDTLNETQNRALQQIHQLKETPLTVSKKLALKTQYSYGPAINHDGQYLAIITVADTDKRSLKILERLKQSSDFLDAQEWGTADSQTESHLQPAGQKDGPPAGTISRANWFHRTNKLIYDKLDKTSRYEKYSDLHIFDLATKKSEQISTALRAREPDVAPEDDEIVFVQLEGGRTHLAVMDLMNKKVTRLFSAPLQERISNPTYFDQNHIIFARRKTDGSENLWLINKKTTEQPQPEIILPNYQQARLANMSSRGLLFVAAQNGVQNLYLASSDLKSARVITHGLTAYFTSDLDPRNGDLYATELTSDGQAVHLISTEEWQKTPQELPKIGGIFADRYPVTAATEMPTTFTKEEYSAGEYLWPQYWFPMIASSTANNGSYFTAQTSGHDPLKYHQYSLSAAWDSGVNRGSFMGLYQNAQMPTWIVAQAAQTNTYFVDNSNIVTDTYGSVSALPDIWHYERNSNIEIGWRHLTSETSTSQLKRTGPFLRYSYNDWSRSGAQISPEDGQSAYFGAVQYIEAASYYSHAQYIYGGNYYWSEKLPARNAINLRLNGIYTPEALSAAYGVSSNAYMPAQDSTSPAYVMRGYPTGAFFGKTLANLNLEYRFPIQEIAKGHGTWPFFISRLHGALVADGVSLHGFAYNEKTQLFNFTDTNKSYWSAGAEARFETTLGYVIPLNFILGVYAPSHYSGGFGMAIQMGGLL